MDNNIASKTREKRIYKTTLVGTAGNLGLLIFKFIAGFLGRSSAMIADAVHSLTDLVTDFIVIVFVKISSKPQDEDHEYGHGKYETLATAIVGFSLLIVGLFLLYEAGEHIWRFANGEEIPRPRLIALIAAVVSILVKEGLYRYTVRVGREVDSPAVIANAWHHRSDAFSSIGTLVGIGGAYILGSKWTVLDPIAAALVSLLIIKVSIDLIKESMNELLEKSLPPEIRNHILEVVNSFEDVHDPHNLRTRRIGTRKAIELHVRMDGGMTVCQSHDIVTAIERRLKEIYGIDTIVTIHVEPLSQSACPIPTPIKRRQKI